MLVFVVALRVALSRVIPTCHNNARQRGGLEPVRADGVSALVSRVHPVSRPEPRSQTESTCTGCTHPPAYGHIRAMLEGMTVRRRTGPCGWASGGEPCALSSTSATLTPAPHTYGRWCFLCAVAGHNTLRRGGEFGTTDGEAWASVAETKGSRWRFVQFFPHDHATVGGRPFCIDWVLPIKDTARNRKRYPILIARKGRLWRSQQRVCHC